VDVGPEAEEKKTRSGAGAWCKDEVLAQASWPPVFPVKLKIAEDYFWGKGPLTGPKIPHGRDL